MHVPDAGSHVYPAKVYLRCEDIAESRTAGHIAMVHEILVGHLGALAYGAEHSRTVSIGHVFAVGIDFYDRAATHHRMIGGILLLGIIGVDCMGHCLPTP